MIKKIFGNDGTVDLNSRATLYSMIDADFAAENIMVDGDDVRLIDFDDAG